ncbi:MAG: ketopantoate reductase family protein [Lachnospiraceae bacterium]|nr:ketopantoate reductase family protein [Lachnospiraceae bacterium]
MKFKTVAILGAGAVGAYFIWGLSEKLDENLWIVADGERKARLEKEGILINGKRYPLHVRTPKEAHGADLLLISTKYGALQSILEDVDTVVDEHTVVMSLLNGVDSEEIIGARIGMEHMVYSMMKIASERKGSSIVFDAPSTLGVYFGEAGRSTPSERMLAIEELFRDTGIHSHMCEDIIRDIWYKYAFNVSRNQPQAMVSCGVGAYEDSEHMAYLCRKLQEEVVAVAAAKGIDISSMESDVGKGSPSNKGARYSTLQDLDAKRHTEVDMFAGAMVRMGKELSIPTPYNDFTYHSIKALEEKNDGKFDY